MKKSISGILASLLLLTGFAACSSNKTNTSSTIAPPAGNSSQASSIVAQTTIPNEDLEYIKAKGEMIIGITYFEPMNYLDTNGELTGFETEFATAVCEILGVTPKFQEISWAAKEIELSAKNIDCIWNGLTISEERKANMSISIPYMNNKQILIVKSENVSTATATADKLNLVAEAGSAGEVIAQSEDFFKTSKYIAVDTQAKALLEVAAGTADACLIDSVMARGTTGEGTDYVNLVPITERSFGDEEYGIAFRKGDALLTKSVNEAIQNLIDNGKLDEIAKKYKLDTLLVLG